VARIGRIGPWGRRSRAVWVSAVFAALAVLVVGLTPWASGQRQLSLWRAADAQVRWIPAGATGLPRYPVAGERTYRTGQLPFGDPSPVQIFHRFKLPSPPAAAWSVFLPDVDGPVQLYVNGIPNTDGIVSSPPGLARSSARSRLWVIPPTYLRAGENRIDILVSGAGMRALTSGVYLGPKTDLEPTALWAEALFETAGRLVLLLSVLAVVANLIAVAFRAPVFHLAVSAAFAAAGARVLLAGAAPTVGQFWPVADQLLVAGMALCVASALRSPWSAGPQARRRGEAGLLILTGLLGAASLQAAGTGAPGAVQLGAVTVAASVLYLVWMLCEAAPRMAASSILVRVLVGCALGLGAVIFSVVIPGVGGLSLAAPPFVAELGLAVSLAAAAVIATGAGLVEGAGRAAALLRERLDQSRVIAQQQLALDETAAALDQKTRQSTILEERQRMARDVHDGIGGQLASLIAQVRLRRVSMDQVEEALVGGLSELRLLVDSLDLVGETLADALASFLVRVRQQTAAAGVRLEWSQTDDLAAEIMDPQWTLNLYRLMQEAITNALRHSGGDRISVSIQSIDGGALSVRIEDNGTAFDPLAVQVGRGLANMAHRAKELRGAFSIGPGETGLGTVVCVNVPAPG
jgi:two-component system sensor histidine kinase UhpB